MYKKTKIEPVILSDIVDENAVYVCKQNIICKDGIFIQGSLVMLDTSPSFNPNKPQCLKICDFERACSIDCISPFGASSINDYNYEIRPENFDEFLKVDEYVTAKYKNIVAKRGLAEGMFSSFKDNRFIKDRRKLIESFTSEEREKYKMTGGSENDRSI